ncbi:MAG TPA: alpha/beta fold hydrolase [Gaiellales bacterium]|nr:alpha/beta fold hydrolase [Gaiellales bacterium]
MSTVGSVTTTSGRRLRIYVDGEPGRPCVFSLHGTPVSGALYPDIAADAARQGLRLVSYDRPGYGGSARHEGRSIADAAADVAAIADHLGVRRFAVWGHSGGGPHALACAALLGERVAACAALSGPAPYDAEGLDYMAGVGEANVEEFALSVAGGEPLREFLECERSESAAADPERLTEAFASLLSDVDRRALTPELAGFLAVETAAALEPGVDGWYDDDLAFVAPWGFDPAGIAVPLRLYHGRHDRFVPASHGEWLAAHIPAADARILEDEGHLSLYTSGARDCHPWFQELLA